MNREVGLGSHSLSHFPPSLISHKVSVDVKHHGEKEGKKEEKKKERRKQRRKEEEKKKKKKKKRGGGGGGGAEHSPGAVRQSRWSSWVPRP